MSVAIATQMLEDDSFVSHHLHLCRQNLRASYLQTTKALEKSGIRYVRGANAGFFVYLDLSSYLPPASFFAQDSRNGTLREYALAKHLLDSGVFLHPGEEHYDEPGWFRLVYAASTTETLEEGLRRLVTPLRIKHRPIICASFARSTYQADRFSLPDSPPHSAGSAGTSPSQNRR